LRYVDLHPEPVEREPSTLAVLAGAALALVALWIVCVFVFFFSDGGLNHGNGANRHLRIR